MAGGLTKTLLVLSLPIFTIVSLYVYCRRQRSQPSNSDQPQADQLHPESSNSRPPTLSASIRSDCAVESTDEMQLINNNPPAQARPVDKQANGFVRQNGTAKDRRNKSNAPTSQPKPTPASSSSSSTAVESVDGAMKELKIKKEDVATKQNTSKQLTFAQVIGSAPDKENKSKPEVNGASLRSTSTADQKKSEATFNGVRKVEQNGIKKTESGEKSSRKHENGGHNRKGNERQRSVRVESNKEKSKLTTELLNTDNAEKLDQLKETVTKLTATIEPVVEPSHQASIDTNHVKSERQEPIQPEEAITEKASIESEIPLPPQTSSVCASSVDSHGDAPDAFANETDSKQLIDSHPQQSHYSDVYSEVS
jgi:hypothetical protein